MFLHENLVAKIRGFLVFLLKIWVFVRSWRVIGDFHEKNYLGYYN